VFVVSIGAGILLGIVILRNLSVGKTWDDWQSVRSPLWFAGTQVLLVAMLVVGAAAGQPVLVGIPLGFCVVFFTVGITRWLRRT
jgi:hypothetical protein